VQSVVRGVFVSQPVRSYILGIINATRNHPDLLLGASPRASLGLMRAAQAEAILHARDFVTPDDVKTLAISVLSHRLILNPEAHMSNMTQDVVMSEILDTVRVPLQDEKAIR
jgi:MoxR-like ATPase